MIKLSKRQIEVRGLASKVPALTQAQMSWAERQYPYFQWVKGADADVRCPSCHEKVSFADKKRKGSKYRKVDCEIRCPHCGAKISIRSYDEDSYYKDKKRRINHLQEDFFSVMSVVGDWQVTRLIYMQRYCYQRKENTPWEFFECCQAWNTPGDNNTYFRALPKKFMPSWCFNPYSLWAWGYECNPDTEGIYTYRAERNILSIRKTNGANYFHTDKIAPRAKIHPYYKQRGLTADFLQRGISYDPMKWFQMFGQKGFNPMWETLIKAGDYDFISRIQSRGAEDRYFTAWKIAQRHHYKAKDTSEWLDLIDMLEENHMDWHNPHYICGDTHEMHNMLLELRRKAEIARAKKRGLEELQKAMEKNEEYVKRVGKYLDMDIHNDSLHIIVLPDIAAFKDEGDHLGHCVFRCRYYLHTDSLILSARDAKGKRWETIEVSLKDFTIVQAYGYGDKHTERHKEICDLVNGNMWQIKDRCRLRS